MTEHAEATPEPKKKACYVGAPAIFKLEEECKKINEAFKTPSGLGQCYLVGSALERPDWRDVDVRFMMKDEEFAALFPHASLQNACWEFDARWCFLTIAVSERLSKATGLPIDLQFQPMTFANARHKGRRHALGMRFAED